MAATLPASFTALAIPRVTLSIVILHLSKYYLTCCQSTTQLICYYFTRHHRTSRLHTVVTADPQLMRLWLFLYGLDWCSSTWKTSLGDAFFLFLSFSVISFNIVYESPNPIPNNLGITSSFMFHVQNLPNADCMNSLLFQSLHIKVH